MIGFEIIYPIGALVLLAAIAYGVIRTRNRTRAEKAQTDAGTRREYAREDANNP